MNRSVGIMITNNRKFFPQVQEFFGGLYPDKKSLCIRTKNPYTSGQKILIPPNKKSLYIQTKNPYTSKQN